MENFIGVMKIGLIMQLICDNLHQETLAGTCLCLNLAAVI